MASDDKRSKGTGDAAPLPPYPSDASSSSGPLPETEPPPYAGVLTPQASTLVPPETLIFRGDAIHSGSAASSPRLYELSHPIGEMREFHTTVELSRVDYRMRSSSQVGAAPPDTISIRRRISTLTRPPPITAPSFPYYLEAASGGMGDVGLEPYSRLRSSGYRVYKATRAKVPGEMRPLGVLFVARARGGGRYDWREGREDGKVLAYESFGQGFCQLQVVEGLERGWRDVLVGAWCLRLWQEVVDAEPRPGLGRLVGYS
ncbi:hypothetical protein VUR80DRAFT_6642 [Thermomyces stellatus]